MRQHEKEQTGMIGFELDDECYSLRSLRTKQYGWTSGRKLASENGPGRSSGIAIHEERTEGAGITVINVQCSC